MTKGNIPDAVLTSLNIDPAINPQLFPTKPNKIQIKILIITISPFESFSPTIQYIISYWIIGNIIKKGISTELFPKKYAVVE